MGARLLIADGDGAWTDLYRAVFSQQGYQVETAAASPECLAKLRQAAPNVLLLDMELPGGGAESVLARLRAASAAHSVAVVLTTYDAAPEDLAQHVVPPVVQCFRKRLHLAPLLETMQAAAVRRTPA